MPKLLSTRLIIRIIFWLSSAILVAIAYFQFNSTFQPCILDYFERSVMFFIVLWSFIGFFYHHTQESKKTWGWIGLILTILGLGITARHLWVQQFAASQAGLSSPLVLASITWDNIILLLKDAFLGGASGCSVSYRIQDILTFTQLEFLGFVLFFFLILILNYKMSEEV